MQISHGPRVWLIAERSKRVRIIKRLETVLAVARELVEHAGLPTAFLIRPRPSFEFAMTVQRLLRGASVRCRTPNFAGDSLRLPVVGGPRLPASDLLLS